MDFSRIKTGDVFYHYNESETYPDYIVALNKIRGLCEFVILSCYHDDGTYETVFKKYEPWQWTTYGYEGYKKTKTGIHIANLVLKAVFGDIK